MYSAFGELLGGKNEAEYSRILYISNPLDCKSGEYAFGIRLYNTGTGLFTSGDPLWGAQLGNSAYHYGYNSPLLFSDPTGLLAGGGGLLSGTPQPLFGPPDKDGFRGFWRSRGYRPFVDGDPGGHDNYIDDVARGTMAMGDGGSDNGAISVTIRQTEDDPGIKIEIHPQVLAAMQAGFKIYPTTYGRGLEPTDFLFDVMPSNLSRKAIFGFLAFDLYQDVTGEIIILRKNGVGEPIYTGKKIK